MDKKLVTQFSYIFEKQQKKINHFCGFLRTVEQSGDKKTDLNFFLKKMLAIQFPYTTQKIFSSNFENLPQNFFCFF